MTHFKIMLTFAIITLVIHLLVRLRSGSMSHYIWLIITVIVIIFNALTMALNHFLHSEELVAGNFIFNMLLLAFGGMAIGEQGEVKVSK